MDLSTIEMPEAEARAAFLDYRRAVRERHTEEDAEIMRGYRELARGRRLIHLGETVRAGGVVQRLARRGGKAVTDLPALAVCRADLEWCYVEMSEGNAGVTFLPSPEYRGRKERLVVRDLRPEGLQRGRSGRWDQWRAMVPIVPPRLRPRGRLAGYHVLWEADWALYTPPRPPGDPALLKRIGGDLWAVLAIWDLTPLEQAVLSRRGRP